MSEFKSSFHFAIGISAAVVTAIIFWLLQLYPTLLIFSALGGLFLTILLLLYFVQNENKKYHTIMLTVVTVISSMLLFSIIDTVVIRWFFITIISLLFGALLGLCENIGTGLSFTKKPFRRFLMMIWVFNAFALFSCLFAVGILFQSEWPVWLEFILLPMAGLIAGYVSGEIWKMYVVGDQAAFLFWRIVVGFFIAELFWCLRLLPHGYFMSGMMLTWLWYVLQMLIRFHFQPQGIVWKKQLPFLVGSAIVFTLLAIFFVRWI